MQATSLKAKEENKHIFRSKGSEGSIRARVGEKEEGIEERDGEGEYEREHREHEMRQGDTKGYNVDDRVGTGRESL